MAIFKTPKEIARGFLLISGTLILAGLYFIPVIKEMDTKSDMFKYLVDCRDKFEIIYTLLVTFFLREKLQNYLTNKDD